MDTLYIVLRSMLIFVLLAVPGYILVKSKVAETTLSAQLSKVLISVGMPFLIISSVAKIRFDDKSVKILAVSALIGIIYHFVLILLSNFLKGNNSDKKNNGVSRFCMVFSNNGFFGLPLAMALFDSASLVITSVIIINIITNILMQTKGISMISGEKSKFSAKLFLNPLLIAFAIAVIANLSGIFDKIPETLTYSTYLSNLVIPMSMLIIGINLAKVDLKKLMINAKMYYVSFIKLIAVPSLIIAILFVLKIYLDVSDELMLGVFISFAMPTAGLAPAYAGIYGGDTEGAVCYTLGTTILSVITIPILYTILTCLL